MILLNFPKEGTTLAFEVEEFISFLLGVAFRWLYELISDMSRGFNHRLQSRLRGANHLGRRVASRRNITRRNAAPDGRARPCAPLALPIDVRTRIDQHAIDGRRSATRSKLPTIPPLNF